VDESAFPHVNFMGQKVTGMTLRDYFAAQVLIGYFANNHKNEVKELGLFDTVVYKEIASHAYEMADEMLKARKNEVP
jgi:hypothetical protein